MIYELKDYVNRLRIALDLYDKRLLNNQNLKILLVELMEKIQSEEAQKRIKNKG